VKVLSFYQNVVIATETVGAGSIDPAYMKVKAFDRIVVNDDMANQILTGRTSCGDWRCPKCLIINHGSLISCKSCSEPLPPTPAVPTDEISDFMPFYLDVAKVRRPAKFRDKRVLFYRNRGIGDQLIASCLSRFFSVVLKAKCFQLADRNHELLWCGNPFIGGTPVRFPLNVSRLIRKDRDYDWFMPMESVSEYDNSREQGNVYDRMFALAGFDPEEIPAEYKRPYWAMTQKDIEESKEFCSAPYIAFQIRATNPGRTLPLQVVDLVLSRLNEIGLPILCMDSLPFRQDVKKVIDGYKNAKDVSGRFTNERQYGTVCSMANLVVGPDSSAIHFAACFDVPCISLFGPFDPRSRVRDYNNHIAIWSQENCPSAPCFNFAEELPYHKCPDGPQQKHCAVFSGVTSDQISDAIEKLGIIK
jgi:hypothetical protein